MEDSCNLLQNVTKTMCGHCCSGYVCSDEEIGVYENILIRKSRLVHNCVVPIFKHSKCDCNVGMFYIYEFQL